MTICSTCQGVKSQAIVKLRNLEYRAKINEILAEEGLEYTGSVSVKHMLWIIVEDIIDSGFTINFLVNRLRESGPKSVTVATALYKKEVAKLDFEVEYVGFEIPPEFVVGYGLDYNERYRNLKDVMVMEPEDID